MNAKCITGYVLVPYDIGAYYYVGSIPDASYCVECGTRNDSSARPQFVRLAKKLDIGCSYDGEVIFGANARELFASVVGCSFTSINTNRGEYYVLGELQKIAIDPEFSPIIFDGKCSICRGWKEIGHFFPIRLINDDDLGTLDIKETELLVGAGNMKNRLVVIGIQAAETIKRGKLRGMLINPIYSSATTRWW